MDRLSTDSLHAMVSNTVFVLCTGLASLVGVRSSAIDTDASWHRYVRSPVSNIVKPVGIVSDGTIGNVSRPNGLVDGRGPTILSRNDEGDLLPTVVVDFGQNVVGILSLEFSGSQNVSAGLPGLRLAFSETMEYLTNRSDFTRSDNAGGVCLEIRIFLCLHVKWLTWRSRMRN